MGESYCYNMKNTMNDEKLKDKINEDDKKTVLDKVDEIIKWMESNQDAQKENTMQNKRKLKLSQILLCKKFNKLEECQEEQKECQEECQEECPEECQAECQGECREVCRVECQDHQDQMLKKSID